VVLARVSLVEAFIVLIIVGAVLMVGLVAFRNRTDGEP